MPFYEIIYETGSKSVGEYANDEEALSAINAHQARAVAGEKGRGEGTPRSDLDEQRNVVDYPAERILKVLVYDEHPATTVSVSADVAESQVADAIKENTDDDGVVDLMALSSAIREMSNPVVVGAGTQESMFKTEEARELEGVGA